MNPYCAYFLVIHGSRDLRVQLAVSKLKQLISSKISTHNILTQKNYLDFNSLSSKTTITSNLSTIDRPFLEIASLELGNVPLHKSLVEFTNQAVSRGFEQVKVVPLFLASGVHVTEDLPREIALAIKQINYQVTVELSPYLGKYSGMVSLLNHKFAQLLGSGRILVAHGSRLPTAARDLSALGQELGAAIAYWSTKPSLQEQITAQIAAGNQKISILPYFLFSGKITEAIAQEVAGLQSKYPTVELVVGEPLGATPELAELIIQEL